VHGIIKNIFTVLTFRQLNFDPRSIDHSRRLHGVLELRCLHDVVDREPYMMGRAACFDDALTVSALIQDVPHWQDCLEGVALGAAASARRRLRGSIPEWRSREYP